MRRVVFGLVVAAHAGAASAQAPGLRIERADGSMTDVTVVRDRGYAAVQLSLFGVLGWTVRESGNEVTVTVPNEIEIGLRVGSPFFHWDGIVFQLADAPYREANGVLLPLQLLTEFLPNRLPDLYEYDGARALLRAGDPQLIGGRQVEAPPPAGSAEALPAGRSTYSGPRVVIIDAGHGGEDPGALGPRGIREKDVALGIALELAAILRRNPGLEIHMIRDQDVFVDLWQRGEIATRLKGDKPGLFVSIHANSIQNQRSTRGFETYFLSEARTEHERRVAAIENAPLSLGQGVDPVDEPDLDFILRELRNLDHQHWSNLLAELTQEELDEFHPGPNRGVKQGILAVLTNTLMPSVLVETGYLSHEEEGRLLGERSFQTNAARAIARAVERFVQRYPPGSTPAGGEDR
jgi:N-acetylmuramoyl-L-alanine amidase